MTIKKLGASLVIVSACFFAHNALAMHQVGSWSDHTYHRDDNGNFIDRGMLPTKFFEACYKSDFDKIKEGIATATIEQLFSVNNAGHKPFDIIAISNLHSTDPEIRRKKEQAVNLYCRCLSGGYVWGLFGRNALELFAVKNRNGVALWHTIACNGDPMMVTKAIVAARLKNSVHRLISSRQDNGFTALHCMVRYNRVTAAKALLDAVGKTEALGLISMMCYGGRTPFELATIENEEEMRKLFEQKIISVIASNYPQHFLIK
jgi:hypothetical protein